MNRRRFLFAAAIGVAALGRGRLPSVPEAPNVPELVLVDGQYGIIRDSVLNATNEYRMFAETFDVRTTDRWSAPGAATPLPEPSNVARVPNVVTTALPESTGFQE